MDIIPPIGDVGLGDQRLEERNGRVDAVDHEFVERPLESHQAFVAVAGMHDQLADQAVVIRGDGVAGVGVAVEPDAGPAGRDDTPVVFNQVDAELEAINSLVRYLGRKFRRR